MASGNGSSARLCTSLSVTLNTKMVPQHTEVVWKPELRCDGSKSGIYVSPAQSSRTTVRSTEPEMKKDKSHGGQ